MPLFRRAQARRRRVVPPPQEEERRQADAHTGPPARPVAVLPGPLRTVRPPRDQGALALQGREITRARLARTPARLCGCERNHPNRHIARLDHREMPPWIRHYLFSPLPNSPQTGRMSLRLGVRVSGLLHLLYRFFLPR